MNMSATIEKQLNETLRDTQLALYLHEFVPTNDTLVKLGIAEHLLTANDLYQYWLLDVLVSQDVPTTPVACAIASLQQYINSILANMEPGYHTADIPADQIETWRTVMHHYPTWAANQQLHYFPAVYLDPTLRQTRTESFQSLENDINQNQLGAESVQTAVLAYLSRLEEVANLNTLNGYIDGTDFANSVYYFIAKSRAANTYYWRSLDMAKRPNTHEPPTSDAPQAKYDAPEPLAWSEWHRINLPINENTIEQTIRPIMFNNRLYVIWAECIFQDNTHTGRQVSKPSPTEPRPAEPSRKPTNPQFRLNLCYKKYDDSWSTPQTCRQAYASQEFLHGLASSEINKCTNTVAMQNDKHLFLALYVKDKTSQGNEKADSFFWMSVGIDKDFNTISSSLTGKPSEKGEDPIEKKILSLTETSGGATQTLQFKLPDENKLESLKAPKIVSCLHKDGGNIQYVDFSSSTIKLSDGEKGKSNDPNRSRIRLNITFTRHLIDRAETSMNTLLSWETQHLEEPPLERDGEKEKMNFYGAYGRYFVELFVYLPWLIAHRFNQSSQYNEAERWLQYLFDPGRKKVPGGNPDYWNAVPLLNASSTPAPGQLSYAIQGPQDPHQIALSHPVHFCKALYMLYIDILLNRGDAAYRTLTPDGLTEAKLRYIRALDLLGPRPDLKQTDVWARVKLKTFSDGTSSSLRNFENQLGKEGKHKPATDTPHLAPQVCVRPYAFAPSVHAIDTPHLRLPFNPTLIARWEKLETRLHNLRHNLDIVGKPLRLPLFAQIAMPTDLLRSNPQRAAEPGIYQREWNDIPPYRFSVIHAQATNAVDTVIQFSNTLLSFIERTEQASYQEIQQQHLWELANVAVQLQTQALKVDQKNREALLASRNIIEDRLNHYSQLVDEVVNPEEVMAAALHLTGRLAEVSGYAAQAIGQGVKVLPNIFGLADGGHRVEGMPFAFMAGAQSLAAVAHGTGETLERSAQYRRRHQEWTLARDQARLEIAHLDTLLSVEAERETASLLQLQHTQKALAQAKISYEFLSKRFTNSQLYQWFIGQLSSFHLQVYDEALSLGRLAELCWRYEMGDESAQSFFQPQTWNSTYRGLGPGESMKVGLLKMKNAYLAGGERELEISKTVSLRKLKDKEDAIFKLNNKEDQTSRHSNEEVLKPKQNNESIAKKTLNKAWDDSTDAPIVSGLKTDIIKGACDFELTKALFDHDYPKHYLRRIKSISISLPAILGPYEDVCAILTQVSAEVWGSNNAKQPKSIQRANQQIALSTGIDDNGLFTLNFQDERYLPFEYTGAVSKWRLSFPNPDAQRAMLESLTDIIVHVRYTARAAGGGQ
jgi:hypothetical protein